MKTWRVFDALSFEHIFHQWWITVSLACSGLLSGGSRANQTKWSESAHLVCLAIAGASTEKIGTTTGLPNRPIRLSETKASHFTFISIEREAQALHGGVVAARSPVRAWCRENMFGWSTMALYYGELLLIHVVIAQGAESAYPIPL